MLSAASDGESPEVWRKRSDKESCPKNFPAASAGLDDPIGIKQQVDHPVPARCVALEYFAKSKAASINPFSSISRTLPWRSRSIGGCPAAE